MTKLVLNAKEVVTFQAPTPDRWSFRVLVDRDISGSKHVAAGHLVVPPGASQPDASVRDETEEVYYCARGRGKLVLDDDEYPLEEGTAAYIGPEVRHQVFNTGDVDLLVVWFESPPSSRVGEYKLMALGWKQIPPA